MKKTPSHFTACVENERQILFFSFSFAHVTEVRHMYMSTKRRTNKYAVLIESHFTQ